MTRPYMAFAGDPSEGAVAVFADNRKEAKRLAFPVVQGWTGCEWTDLRVRRLPGDCAHLRLQDGPHVNDEPGSCERCEQWYAEPLINGLCETCFEDPETWDEP